MSAATASGSFSSPQERVSTKKLLWAAPLSGIIAAVANAVLFFIYQAIGLNIILPIGNPADPTQATAPLILPAVLMVSFLPALGAGVLLFLLSKLTKRPITIFTIVSIVLLVLSFGMSISLDIPAVHKIALDLMHVVAAIAIVGGLRVFARE
jgi:hypothetical protein